jgi:hypothetical protein
MNQSNTPRKEQKDQLSDMPSTSEKPAIRTELPRSGSAHSESSKQGSEQSSPNTPQSAPEDEIDNSTVDGRRASPAQTGKNRDLSGLFKKVVVGKQPAPSMSSKDGRRDNVAPPDSKVDEPQPSPEDRDATKLLNVYHTSSESAPKEVEGAASRLEKDDQHSSRLNTANPSISNLPRIAGEDESTQYFQIPGTKPPLYEDPSASGKQKQGVGPARQSIGFTQLLRSVSSQDEIDITDLDEILTPPGRSAGSHEGSAEQPSLASVKATDDQSRRPSSSFGNNSFANARRDHRGLRKSAADPGLSAHASGRTLHDLLPWLVVLNLAITAVTLVVAVCILFHISIPWLPFLPSRN